MVCSCLCLSLTHKTRWRMVRTNKVSPHTKPRLPLVGVLSSWLFSSSSPHPSPGRSRHPHRPETAGISVSAAGLQVIEVEGTNSLSTSWVTLKSGTWEVTWFGGGGAAVPEQGGPGPDSPKPSGGQRAPPYWPWSHGEPVIKPLPLPRHPLQPDSWQPFKER